MQLNEVIEENSIDTIAKRTRISVENIERLVNRDFSMIKRVKAQGFISILEREFRIELDSLRKECEDYFSSAPDEEFDADRVISVVASRNSRKKSFSKLLPLFALFVLGYASWYFFMDKEQNIETSVSTNAGDNDFIGKIVSQAQEWLGSSNTIVNDNNPSSLDGVWAKKDSDTNETGSNPQSDSSAREDAESNDSINEEKIIREAKEEQEEIIAQEEAEDNSTDPFSIESIMGTDMLDESNSTTEDPENIESSDTLSTEVPSVVEPIKKQSKKELAKKKKIVIFHPLKKVWIGYTNLDTMKREAKVAEGDIEFDTAAGKWILVAGHGSIVFQLNGEDIELEKKAKNYFLIKNGKVESIGKEEFQKLNKSKVW